MRIKKLFITMLTLSLLSVNMPFTVFAEEVNIDETSEDTDNEEVSIVEETSSTEESSGAVSDTEDGIEETIDETSEESLRKFQRSKSKSLVLKSALHQNQSIRPLS